MQKTLILFLASVLIFGSSCNSIAPDLIYAKDYEVVSEENIDLNAKNRTGKHFQIISDASTIDEMAQTSMLAAYELSKEHNLDLSLVLLVPAKELINTGIYYTQVEYASDNKGATGLPGIDKNLFNKGEWFVKSTENTLNDNEILLAKLWYKYQNDFPSKNWASSLSYDKSSLINYIAKELNIDPEQVTVPKIILTDYTNEVVKNRMYPQP